MHGRAVLKIGDRQREPSNDLRLCQDAANADFHQKEPSNPKGMISGKLRDAIEWAGRDFRSDTVTVPTGAMMDVRKG